MKKFFVLLLPIIFTLIITSCAGNEEKPVTVPVTKPATTEQTTSTAPETTTVKPTEKPAKTKKSSKKIKQDKKEKPTKKTKPTTMPPTQGRTRPNTHIAVTSPPKGSFSSSDFIFKFKNHTIKLNDKTEDIFKLIGDDYSLGELSSTRNEYEYDNFILTAYKKSKDDETERIDTIEIIEKGAQTTKGAKIGMYATRLKRLYGDPNKLSETEYVYGSGSKTLTFTYEGNIVTGIIYKYKH